MIKIFSIPITIIFTFFRPVRWVHSLEELRKFRDNYARFLRFVRACTDLGSGGCVLRALIGVLGLWRGREATTPSPPPPLPPGPGLGQERQHLLSNDFSSTSSCNSFNENQPGNWTTFFLSNYIYLI